MTRRLERCRRWQVLLLAIAAHEGVAAGGISNAQEAELHRLLEATSEAIQELPAGHRSKDKLRLLHGKLESLRAVSADAEEHEWDAMVQALLDSTEYGSAHVEALLQARDGAAAPACDADGADGAGASVGRRLQEAEEAVDARSRAEGARAQGPAEEWPTAAGARGPLARRWDAWKRWMLDRPPPWERDCDCCYAHCPEHLNCLLQSDKLYLACRGDSVGQVLEKQWAERPCTLVGGSLLTVLLVVAWLVVQARKLCGRRGEPPEERRSENADSDSD